MPEERPLGALVDPRGLESVALNSEEYGQLKTALAIVRRRDYGDMSFSVLNHLLIVEGFAGHPDGRPIEEWDGLAGFLEWIDQHAGSDGILVDARSTTMRREIDDGSFGKEILRLEGHEFAQLRHALLAIRAGGWFAEWLKVVTSIVAGAKSPIDKYPTPLQVMQMLTVDAAEFEKEMDAAKDFALHRPDLLFPTPPAKPEAVPEPSTTSTKPKRQRARRARRKAA